MSTAGVSLPHALQEAASLVTEINICVISSNAAKKNLRDRFAQLDQLHLRLAKLQRKWHLVSQGKLPASTPAKERSSIFFKPFGYSQVSLRKFLVSGIILGDPAHLRVKVFPINLVSSHSLVLFG